MMINLDALFRTGPSLAKYQSTREELRAVASGSKSMSYFQFPSASMETHPFYTELRQIASELNLSIVVSPVNEDDPDPRLRVTNVFVTQLVELWRIPAYSAFKAVFENYNWSDPAEHFESMLLGYSTEDIEKWLNARTRSQIGWKGRTFYLLLSPAEAAGVLALSKRCMDPQRITNPIRVFFNRMHNPIRTEADCLLSERFVLARVSVHRLFFKELFGNQTTSETEVIASLLTPEQVPQMTSALDSHFQFLEGGAWK